MLQNIRKLKTELLEGVEHLVKNKSLTPLEATIHFCERHDVDLEQAAQIVVNDKKLTKLIEKEARSLNFLKK